MMVTDKKEILAVDDTLDNLLLLEVILDDDNYHLNCVDSGKLAIEAVATSVPDLILLDVMMPGMNGYDVTRRIRQDFQLSDVPILLITAHDNITEREWVEAGADGLLRKPFDITELLSWVEKLLPVNKATA